MDIFDFPIIRHKPKLNKRRKAQLATMTYENYLKTPEWYRMRNHHLRVAGFQCQICGKGTRPLHLHHRKYSVRGLEQFQDLIVMCRDCHYLYHEHVKRTDVAEKEDRIRILYHK